jgi:hypothetical protein
MTDETTAPADGSAVAEAFPWLGAQHLHQRIMTDALVDRVQIGPGRGESPEEHAAGQPEAEPPEAVAPAKPAHDAVMADLDTAHLGVAKKLGDLEALLAASRAKAADDPDHAAYTASFLRDVDLKVDEIIAWIKRTA